MTDLEIEDLPGSPPDLAWTVTEVAAGSPAHRLGIVPGDQLIELDGQTAAEITPASLNRCARRREFVFYRKAAGHFRKSPLVAPSGIRARPSARLIEQRFDPGRPDFEGALWLWEEGCWQPLVDLCRRTLWPRWKPGLLGRFLGPRQEAVNSPLVALYGAALWELGQHAEGLKWVEEFERRFMGNWTLDFHSVVTCTRAGEELRQGRRDQAAARLVEAYRMNPVPAVACRLQALGASLPMLWPRLGQPFPLRYRLACVAGGAEGDLEEGLAKLVPGQCLLLCFLGHYRGNGPYNDFVQRFRGYRKVFPGRVAALQVVTETAEKRADRPYWYIEEEKALAEGNPVSILLDAQGILAGQLELRAAPTLFALNRDGTVVYEGFELDGFDWWELLGRLPDA